MQKSFLLALMLLELATVSEACKCVQRTPNELFDSAGLVYVGKVVATTQKKDSHGGTTTTASMQVESSWKGLRGVRTQIREMAQTSCSVGFQVGIRYLVYAREDGTVEFCSGTRKAETAEEIIKALGASIPLK